MKPAGVIDWSHLETTFGAAYRDGPGQPPLPTRLLAGVAILRYMHTLSDEALCARWIENPCCQFFCGDEFFQHKLTFDRSSMTRWRQRMGEEKLFALLQECLATATCTDAAKPSDFTQIIVNTTVQPIHGRIVRHSSRSYLFQDALPLRKRGEECVMSIKVRLFETRDQADVLALIVGIQQREFGIPITAEDQPDLTAIPDFYGSGSGGFWVADQDGTIVGTIGLKDIGARAGALRKMFVSPHVRGGVLGPLLLTTLLTHARARGLAEVYLGTTQAFHAAHRFYEKHGFAPVARADLPTSFPVMSVDTRFYRLALA